MEFVEFWWNANGINNETNGMNRVDEDEVASYPAQPIQQT